MAGCFGDNPIDRYLERQLDEWLEEEEMLDEAEEDES